MFAVTATDVEERLGRPLDGLEVDRVAGLLDEATALVSAHCGQPWDAGATPIPPRIRIVVSRMVARVLQAPDDGLAAESASFTAGPFSQNVRYAGGGSGGGPWLSATDRKLLAPFVASKRAVSFPIV